MKYFFFLISLSIIFPSFVSGQQRDGAVEGTILDSASRQPLTGASVELQSLLYGNPKQLASDKTGFFSFDSLSNGYFRLIISFSGYGTKTMDSLYIHPGKKEIILGDLFMKPGSSLMDEVVIYAEKPMIQTKDGNIVLNVGESPLSAGSNAADLLKTMPLVTSDPDGKVSVRGREPRILIDDKPVELNGQQLNDFLESLPGGMVEKIELMSNPPPQYANEPGGVINIVTRKGKVGFTGRTNLFAGSRGEVGINNSFNYRRKGLVMSVNVGGNLNKYEGNSSGYRQNFYKDSSNALRTANRYVNQSARPNLQFNVEYDVNPRHNLNVQLLLNGNDFTNDGLTTYRNFNTREELYRQSDRSIISDGNTWNPSVGFNYLYRGKKPGERFRVNLNANLSDDETVKDFRQKYFNGLLQSTGTDSVQSQNNQNQSAGWSGRLSYDRPLGKGKTVLSTGFSRVDQRSHILMDTYFQDRQGNNLYNALFSSDLLFKQQISSTRLSVRQTIVKGLSITTGAVWEVTGIDFDIYSQQKQSGNRYENLLPFLNASMNLPSGLNVNASYRKAIRRPGIRELNPAIDYTDPINIRFGNPELSPSPSHNIDLTGGMTKPKYYFNLGLGYNLVDNIFAPVRTLVESGKTNITWQNISAKKEYEVSGWAGFEVFKGFRVNVNGGYNYSSYSEYDRKVNRYRNGASVNGKINLTYVRGELWNFSTNIGYNRFANPQGTVRSTVSMHFGVQRKFFRKKLIMALGIVDPFIQQGYNNTTIGANFKVNSTGTTTTRNFRISATYLFNLKPVKTIKKKK